VKAFAKGYDGSTDDEGGLFVDSVEAAPINLEKTTTTRRTAPLWPPRTGENDGNIDRTESQ
jgi:hypothetical protein